MFSIVHTTANTMKISRNGQVSIPAAARRRWNTDRVVVVDMGDYVVMSPVGDDPIGEVLGSYGAGPSSDEMRVAARAEDAAAEDRRR